MTVIKYFDDSPHIIRFGMTDPESGKSQMQLWRNGVHFQIETNRADVRGTDFERQWTPLLDLEPILSSRTDLWSELCGLVISQCMGILQELAPKNKPYWTTIYDYLHVESSYTLRLYAAPGSDDAAPRLVQGPGPGPGSGLMMGFGAYEMQPVAWNTFAIPDDLPVFDSRMVTPLLHQEQDLKNPPKKVRLPYGAVAFFFPCRIPTRRWEEGSGFVEVNESHQSIASYLLLQSLHLHPPGDNDDTYARIPKVLGVVSYTESPNDEDGEDERKVAGILLEWIDGFRLSNLSLSANRHVIASNEASFVCQAKKWKEQVTGLVRNLHQHYGVSSLGVDINPFDIIIDRNGCGHAWLTGFINCEKVSEEEEEEEEEDYSSSDTTTEGIISELERKQIQMVFDQWLSAELSEGFSSSSSEDPDEVRKGALSRWFAISDSQN